MSTKSLYINGCSFTRGDSLKEEQTWPYLLQKLIQPKYYINDSANGNSFGSIFYTTLTELSKMESYENLFVVIGITWSPRYAVFFDKIIASITPADIFNGGTKTEFFDKRSTHRRMVSHYFQTHPKPLDKNPEMDIQSNELDKNTGFDETLTSFAKFYANITKNDPNIKNNQNIALLTKVLALQSFFEANKINYKFIDFSQITSLHTLDTPSINLKSKLNFNNIINLTEEDLNTKNFIDQKTSHPNKEGCEYIANKLFNIYNEL